MEEKIFHRKLSKREKILLGIFFITLLEFMFYKILIVPKERDIYESNLKISKIENQIDENKIKEQNKIESPKENKKKEVNEGSVDKFLNLKTSEITNFINGDEDNSYTLSFKGNYEDIIDSIKTLGAKGRAYEFQLSEDDYTGNIFAKTNEKIVLESTENNEDTTKSLKDIFLKKDKTPETTLDKDKVKKDNSKASNSVANIKEENIIKNNGEFYIESSSENSSIKSIDDMLEVRYTNLEFKNNYDMQFIDLFFENFKINEGESLKIVYYPVNQWGTFGYIDDMKRYPIYAGYIQEKNNQIIIPDAKDINGFYYQIDENTYNGVEEGIFYIVKISILDEFNNEKELKLTYLDDEDEDELKNGSHDKVIKRKNSKSNKVRKEKTNENNSSENNSNNSR
ncbi:hypothetical protein [Peptoniphilus sp.]|uniref:hypothetical protein n=1 Tax=Peptoniphilus sp. TaxID=1971214 RepID=UPI003993E3AA